MRAYVWFFRNLPGWIDRLFWDDRYESMRHLIAYGIVIVAAIYFIGQFAAAVVTR